VRRLAGFDEVGGKIILVHAVTHDHDATLARIVETADHNTIELQDGLLDAIGRKVRCIVWIVDKDDVGAETGDAAVK